MAYHKRWTPEQIQHWEAVRDGIKSHPDAYDQQEIHVSAAEPACGTAECILGWGFWVAFGASREMRVERDLLEINGLSPYEYTSVLVTKWKAPFEDRYDAATTNRQRAKVAVAYLNSILKTGEV